MLLSLALLLAFSQPNRIDSVVCVAPTLPDSEPTIEITVSSPRAFPVRDQLVVLKIGSVTSLRSRYPDGSDLHSLIFSLTPDEFGQVNDGDPVVIQYGVDESVPPSDSWFFEPFDASLAAPC